MRNDDIGPYPIRNESGTSDMGTKAAKQGMVGSVVKEGYPFLL